jgi:rare lipoprotein A
LHCDAKGAAVEGGFFMAKSTTKLTLLWTALATALAGCSSVSEYGPPRVQPDPLVSNQEQANGDLIPRAEPPSRTGNPDTYVVFGRRYRVQETSAGYREQGVASWYGRGFHGRKTSSGPLYNMFDLTAAHKSLPIPTYVRVTNLDNGRNVVVKVTDRGPFVGRRIIDLSYAAANRLDMLGRGTAQVEIMALEPYQFVPALAARRSRNLEHLASRQALPEANFSAPTPTLAHNDVAQLAEAKPVAKTVALDATSKVDEAIKPAAQVALQSTPKLDAVPAQAATTPATTPSNPPTIAVTALANDGKKLALAAESGDKSQLTPVTSLLDQSKVRELEDAPILDVPAVRQATTKPRIIAHQNPIRPTAPTTPRTVSTKVAQKPAPTPPTVAKSPATRPDENRVASSPLRLATAEPMLKNKRAPEERRTSTDSMAKNSRPAATSTTPSPRAESRPASERPATPTPRDGRKATSPTNRQEPRNPSRAAISKPSDIRLAGLKTNRARLVTD